MPRKGAGQGRQSVDPPEAKPSVPSTAAESSPTVPVAEAREERRPPRVSPPNHIYVGKKPVMSYAMSALIQLVESGEIVLKARGMVISRAVDVAEIVTKRLGNNAYAVKDIRIDTERVGVGGDARNVSTIEIVVGRK